MIFLRSTLLDTLSIMICRLGGVGTVDAIFLLKKSLVANKTGWYSRSLI